MAPTKISLAEIEANPWQPRADFDEAQLEELADSIRRHGLLQPLLVRPRGEGGGYFLIAGERRFRACKEAGLEEAPAIVLEVSDVQTLVIALTENIQRADLDPIEEATGYRMLKEKFGLTQEEIAEKVGKPRSTIANLLRLLSLPPEIQDALREKEISAGHARAIAGLNREETMVKALDTVVRRGLNVRQTEELCREMSSLGAGGGIKEQESGKPERPMDPNIVALERALESRLGTRCRIVQRGNEAGRVEIEYYDLDQLDGLLRLLGVEFE